MSRCLLPSCLRRMISILSALQLVLGKLEMDFCFSFPFFSAYLLSTCCLGRDLHFVSFSLSGMFHIAPSTCWLRKWTWCWSSSLSETLCSYLSLFPHWLHYVMPYGLSSAWSTWLLSRSFAVRGLLCCSCSSNLQTPHSRSYSAWDYQMFSQWVGEKGCCATCSSSKKSKMCGQNC